MSVFRHNAEDDFPWASIDNSVWYAVFAIKDGAIVYESFPPKRKAELLDALRVFEAQERRDVLLIGVWTGRWTTHLFHLDQKKAIARLEGMLRKRVTQ